MSDRSDESTYDVRLVERSIRKGTVERKAYEERLKKLPDMADQAEKIDLEALTAEGLARVPRGMSKSN